MRHLQERHDGSLQQELDRLRTLLPLHVSPARHEHVKQLPHVQISFPRRFPRGDHGDRDPDEQDDDEYDGKTEERKIIITDDTFFHNGVDLRREMLEGIIHSICTQGDLSEVRHLLDENLTSKTAGARPETCSHTAPSSPRTIISYRTCSARSRWTQTYPTTLTRTLCTTRSSPGLCGWLRPSSITARSSTARTTPRNPRS
ncbi:unnamed protein product [Pylaiella littoralis]